MKISHLFLVRLLLLSLLTNLIISSCSQEDLLTTIIDNNGSDGNEPNPDPDSTDPTTPIPDGTAIEDLVINTTPCDYTLDSVTANMSLEIECQLNLGGKTINLPTGVTLIFKGGEIINGTLNFGTSGKIDGDLLNAQLEVTGNVSLINEVFQFHPSRWELVQGVTTSEIAQKNNDNLEGLMRLTKSLGATTFSIDKFDAYFEVSKVTSTTSNQNFYPSKEAINIPSDYTLLMSENTILRVFPGTNQRSGTLIGFDGVSNANIKGGTLYGDRDLRSYSGTNSSEGSLLLTIRSGKNIIVDGVKLTMSARAGITINSYGFTFDPDYDPTHDVTIKNCMFEKIREMSFSITDGYNILVDNNTFIDTAYPTAKSDGGVVGYAMNIEPVRTRNATTGELVLYQKVDNVIISNNVERNSRVGSFNIYSGNNIIIENNDVESVVSYTLASNSKIRNNTFTAIEDPTKPAIIAGGAGETVFGNEISGNTIIGYGVGISANHRDVNMFDNKINDCGIGIQLKQSFDMKIYGNVIKSSLDRSRGIMAHIADVNNVEIFDNEISVLNNPVYFVQLNVIDTSKDFEINVHDNNFTNSGIAVFSNSRGIKFINNSSKGGMQLSNTFNVAIVNNIITTSNSHGISLSNENYNVNIDNNKITYSSDGNFECIKIAITTNKNEIRNLDNNSCN